jgi:hypothetical protein
MTSAAAAGLLAGLLAGAVAAGQTAPAPPANMERLEIGQLRSAAGVVENYRIRLLPVDSFPALPPPVAAWLRELGCMIPQTFEAQQPENVIHGDFRAPGSGDWAALCSAGGETTLYVFFAGQAGQFDTPIPLRSQPDTYWLGHEPGSSVFGSAWGISTGAAADLRASSGIRAGFPIDHDGIEDAFLERSLTVRYFQAGRWQILFAEDFQQ